MAHKHQIIPITTLKNRTAELVKQVSETGSSVVITQNGEAKVVVMDMKSYDRWRDAMAMMKILSLAEKDVEDGQLLTSEEVFDRIDKRIDEAENKA